MRLKSLAASLMLLRMLSLSGLHAQVVTSSVTEVKKPNAGVLYVDPAQLNLALVLANPPAIDSSTTKMELQELHRLEGTRSQDEIVQAKADDQLESIFIFRSVLGPKFSSESLPQTSALSANLAKEASAAGAPLKKLYQRPRPYQFDHTLHPVCEVGTAPNSYPSGHALVGYLTAFTLIEMVPERRQEILERTDEYIHNRQICGVHYASDTEASRRVAYAVFGALLVTPAYQRDLAVAREETRRALGLPTPTPSL
jgi:acid phosphatase (class A)